MNKFQFPPTTKIFPILPLSMSHNRSVAVNKLKLLSQHFILILQYFFKVNHNKWNPFKHFFGKQNEENRQWWKQNTGITDSGSMKLNIKLEFHCIPFLSTFNLIYLLTVWVEWSVGLPWKSGLLFVISVNTMTVAPPPHLTRNLNLYSQAVHMHTMNWWPTFLSSGHPEEHSVTADKKFLFN